jgi:hypothetical protein
MPDLKLDVESAVATIGKQLDRSIESLRGTAEGLVSDIKSVAEVLDGPMRLNIADADAACVIDLTIPNYDSNARYVYLSLDGSGSCGGRVELASPLPSGKYRAVILLNKISET